jgi:Tfp pilus assembly pilus retraction ATPase PilT
MRLGHELRRQRPDQHLQELVARDLIARETALAAAASPDELARALRDLPADR